MERKNANVVRVTARTGVRYTANLFTFSKKIRTFVLILSIAFCAVDSRENKKSFKGGSNYEMV